MFWFESAAQFEWALCGRFAYRSLPGCCFDLGSYALSLSLINRAPSRELASESTKRPPAATITALEELLLITLSECVLMRDATVELINAYG